MPSVLIFIKYDQEQHEYCVVYVEDGERIEARCYYTHDSEDARLTLEMMRREVEDGG